MKKNINNLKNGKSITRISVFLLFAAILIGLRGVWLIGDSVKRQQQMEEARVFYRQLGSSLEHATDYMNKEIQVFAVTGEMSHFYNYWTEANITKTREEVLREMEKSKAPDEELWYLRQVKKISDYLMGTENRAIELVLHAKGITRDTFLEGSSLDKWVSEVLAYPIEPEIAAIPREEMQQEAVRILFDREYLGYKSQIVTLTDSFNTKMNERMKASVRESRKDTRRAAVGQIMFMAFSFTILGGLLLSFHFFFLIPVQKYTEDIKKQAHKKGRGILKVVPAGSQEMVQFGEEFNAMSRSFYQEIENRKKAERMMARAKDEADKANEFKSVFLAQFSHEIRTPLNAVSGYTWLLLDTKLDDEQKTYAGNIRLACENLLQVINHILDYSKIEAGKMLLEYKDFSLRSLVEELYHILEYEAKKKGLFFILAIGDGVPDFVRGDAVRLYQVLQNLVYNAIKFTERGQVKLTLEAGEEENGKTTVSFFVEDSGKGIAREDVDKIFEPYSQSRSGGVLEGGGTGLGLAICQEIVKLASNGRYKISVKSEEDVGSCFSFQMEFGKADGPVEEEKEILGNAEGVKVLLVEDNPVNLALEKRILARQGFLVDAVDTPTMVEEMVRRKSYDLILLDIGMPGLNGYELARRLRKLPGGGRLLIVALTAYRKQDMEGHEGSEYFDGCLSKPVDPDLLRTKLAGYLSVKEEERKEDGEGAPYVDFARLNELLDYDKDALEELLAIFLEDKKDTKRELLSCISKKETRRLHSAIHSLKGVSANLFCAPLEAECKKMLRKMEGEKEYFPEKEELMPLLSVFGETFYCMEKKLLHVRKQKAERRK